MPLLGVEPLVNAFKAYVLANAAAKATALNAEYADSVALTAPVAVYISERQIASVPAYPVAFVMALRERTDVWSINGAGGAQTKPLARLRIGLMDRSAAGDADELERKKWRYARLMKELLIEAESADALAGHHLGTGEPTFELEWSDNIVSGSFMVSGFAMDVEFNHSEAKS